MADFILASASPRRRELLGRLGLDFVVRPSDIEEIPHEDESPLAFAERAARDKALAGSAFADLPVLASDTVVAIDRDILGKPADREEAAAMLRRLSGRRHVVHTGMALARGNEVVSLLDSTEVSFLQLDDASIRWYLQTGEAMDKAGAYAVQGAAAYFIDSIIGAPQTVIGLPIHRLGEIFAALGLNFSAMLGKCPPRADLIRT